MKITKDNLKDIRLFLHPKQETGWIQGHELYQHLKDNNLLEDCLTEDNLKEIQKLGLEEFNKYFKGKYVFAWKSVQGDGVPCLIEVGGKVVLLWCWLDYDWDASNPALRLRKSVLSTPDTKNLPSETLNLDLEKICCFKNIDKPVRLGRANYACPVCKTDVSMIYFFYQECIRKSDE